MNGTTNFDVCPYFIPGYSLGNLFVKVKLSQYKTI
jgi:hypothetical protein